jgi:hypothetical protein
MPTMHARRSVWPATQTLLAALADVLVALRTPRGPADELEEARELLAYWEQRERRLPWWAVRRRREAREMAWRWRQRTRAAEAVRYGTGVLGVASQLAVERRVPTQLARRGRQAARVALYAAATTAILLMVLVIAVAAALGGVVIDAL